jgi:drug/metabolite transporter (DMT)-like permease
MKALLKSREIQGEIFIFLDNSIWALFPIFVILTVSKISSIFAAAISTLFAALFFAILVTYKKQWREIKVKKALKDILIMTALIGILFYILLFIAVEQTTAGNASIILLMEVFFTMVILGLWRKEKQTIKSVGGGFLMVIGAIFVMFKGGFVLNQGDIIILLATVLPPIGNYYSQRARKLVGSNIIMFVRSVVAGLFMLGFAFIVEQTPSLIDIKDSLLNLFITGFVILGLSKIFWIEAIHRISITKAITLTAYAPAFTLVFAYFILGDIPTIWQILGFIPMVIGIYLISEIKNFAKQN